MGHASHPSFVSRLLCLRSILLAALAATMCPSVTLAQGSNITTLAQYQGIVDPALGPSEQELIFLGPITSPYTSLLIEAWRQEAINFLGALDSQVQGAMAKAITTTAVRNLRVAVEGPIQGGRHVIAKLKTDLQWYENNINSRFANDDYRPTPDEERFWERYQAIKKALKSYTYQVQNTKTKQIETKTLANAEAMLEAHAAAVREGLLYVLDRLTRAEYALGSLRTDSGYLAERFEALNETIFGLQHMALALNEEGRTPRRQLRANFTNSSTNLVFFIQVYSRDPRTDVYGLRPDTAYPMVLYPDVSQLKPETLQALQIQPTGSRGASRTWLPISPRDLLVVRVATMGQVRDRIRFLIIKGRNVVPELRSLSRGFYYLGYQVETPGDFLQVSRWYPVQETYSWAFRGGWAPGETANDPQVLSSNGFDLRGLDGLPDLKLAGDRMQWRVPASAQAAEEMGKAWAEVAGTAQLKFVRAAAARITITDLVEEGRGNLELRLEAW